MVKVIVNSMPKSGTHLVGTLMNLIGFQESHPGLMASLVRETDRNPINRQKKRSRKIPPYSDDGLPIDLGLHENWIRKDWLHNFLTQIPEGSYVVAHLPFDDALSDFLVIHGFHIIYIYRDPRDVLISYINYMKKFKNYPFYQDFNQMDREESVKAILSGLQRGSSILSPLGLQLERSKGWMHDGNALPIRFEELIGPKGCGDADSQKNVVSRILAKVGISVSSERLDNIVEEIFDSKSQTFNKGKVNQWKDWFDTPGMTKHLDSLSEIIKDYGYT